jgi:hypothetical protein
VHTRNDCWSASDLPLDPSHPASRNFGNEGSLTLLILSAHLAVATADSKQRSITFRRSLHMIVELGKVTKETQEISQPLGAPDHVHYQYPFG